MDDPKRRTRPERRRKVSLVGPEILIGLGIVILLSNLGVLAWSVWDVIFRLWPILLVALGLEIILSRLSAWGSLLAVVLTVAMLAGALWLLGSDPETGQVVTRNEVRQAVGVATRAEAVIGPSAGSLHIEALPESANLVEGLVRVGRGQRVKRHFAVAGKTASFILQTEGATFGPFIS